VRTGLTPRERAEVGSGVVGGVEAMVHFENGRSQLGSFGKTPEKGSGLTVGEDRYLVWRVETRPPNPLQVWVEKDRSRSGEAAVREAATARVTDADRPRYMLHYSDRDGRDRGGVMRSFDEPLHEGREFAGVGGLCRVVRVEESVTPRGLGHAWVERAEA